MWFRVIRRRRPSTEVVGRSPAVAAANTHDPKGGRAASAVIGDGTKPYAARVGFGLAQVNVSRLLAPLDSPLLAEFMAALDEVNADGDAAPGFRWRL